jgi:hypothetical protein
MATPLIPVVAVPGAGAVGYKAAESGLETRHPMMGSGAFLTETPDGYNIPIRGDLTLETIHVPIPGYSYLMPSGLAEAAGWSTDSGDVRFGHAGTTSEGTLNDGRMVYMIGNGIVQAKTY